MQMVTKLKAELGNSRKMIDTTIEGFKEDYAKTQEELREKQHKVQALEVQTVQLQAKNRECQCTVQAFKAKNQELDMELAGKRLEVASLLTQNQQLQQRVAVLKARAGGGGGGCIPSCSGSGDNSLQDIGDIADTSSSAADTPPADIDIRAWLDSVSSKVGAAYADKFEAYGYDSAVILADSEHQELVAALNDMG